MLHINFILDLVGLVAGQECCRETLVKFPTFLKDQPSAKVIVLQVKVTYRRPFRYHQRMACFFLY